MGTPSFKPLKEVISNPLHPPNPAHPLSGSIGVSDKIPDPLPPSPGQTYTDVFNAQLDLAPKQFAAESLYDPQYAQLYGSILRNSLLGTKDESGNVTSPGLLDTYSQAAPQMQDIQNRLNTSQLGSNLGNLQNILPGMVSSIQGANPQLQALQQQMAQRAMAGAPAADMATAAQTGAPQNPLSMLGSWNDPRMSPTAQTTNPLWMGPAGINYNLQGPMQAQAGGNTSLDQLNQTAQQQLALGGQLGQGERDQIANRTLSYMNTMGRGTDSSAAANLALNMDQAQQARLAQREQMAGNVSGLNQVANQQGLQAQMANQGAGLQFQGMGLGQATNQAGFFQQAGLANQQADLASQQGNQGANLQAQLAQQQGFLGQQGMTLQGSDLYSQLLSQQGLANAGFGQQTNLANQQQQYYNSMFNQQQMGQANSALMGTTMPGVSAALSSTLGPASGLGAAQQAGQQAGGFGTTPSGFDPFGMGTQLYSQYYNAQQGAQVANANMQAGQQAGTMSALGSLGSAALMFL